MAVYRVVNEDGYKEDEHKTYAPAKMRAEELCNIHDRRVHYRVEQVEIVYHTTWEQQK